MHHRTAEFREIFTRTLADLKTFIGTTNDVLILASSGSGAMEAAISNLTSPGEKVVVLTAGKFGERWRDLAKAFACQIELLEVLPEHLKVLPDDLAWTRLAEPAFEFWDNPEDAIYDKL